ncbi:hypothetical protein [Pantoea septica]|uniref:hypothetical protein n=1 Tax=Pantoea TaxID=53335 RepID=UPI002912AC1F|nr:hypothetical protein [Staphylococcus lugdunensis]
MGERDRFELWLKEKCGVRDESLLKVGPAKETYFHSRIRDRWEAWQASRAAIEIEIYDFDSFSPYDCGEDAVWTTELIRTLAKRGIIVKE